MSKKRSVEDLIIAYATTAQTADVQRLLATAQAILKARLPKPTRKRVVKPTQTSGE